MRLLTARRFSRSVLVSILTASLAGGVEADVLQWDAGPGTAGVQDGPGTWQVGAGNWLNQSTTTPDVVWVNGSDAIFGGDSGAAGAVTLGGPITAQSITFNASLSGTYTISGDILTIVDGLIMANADAAINSVINGTAGLTKTGAGTLTLGGTSANTYTGTAIVNDGVLILSKTGQNAITGNLDISDGGKVRFGADNQIADTAAVTVTGSSSVFNGDGVNTGVRNLNETIGSLTVVGGTVNTGLGSTGLVVTGTASFTGGTTSAIFLGNSGAQVSVNELRITGMNAVAGGTVATANSFSVYGNSLLARSTLTVGSGGLFLDGSTLNLRRGTVTNPEGDEALGSRLVLNGDVTTVGTAASRINLDTAGGTLGTVSVELSSTAGAVTRTFTTGPNLSVSVGLVNGAATTASIVKTGLGTLTLSAANTFNGATTVQQGGMILDGAAGSLSGTTALTITGGSTFRNGSTTAATNNAVTNRINSAATLTLGGSTFTHAVAAAGNSHNQTLASLTILQGVSTINPTGATGTNTLFFTGAGGGGYVRQALGTVNFVTNSGFTVEFTNAPTGAGGSSVSGGANAILIGATLNGRDFIAAQAGVLTAATYVPTGTTDWVTGANMDVTGTNPVPYAATNINSLRFGTAGAFTVALAGTHTIDTGMILVTDLVGANASTLTGGTLRGSLNGELTVMQNNLGVAGMFTIGSNIENNGGPTVLNKTGLGILSLTGTNTYTGQTLVAEGILRAVDGVGLSNGSNLNIAGGLFAPGSAADFTRTLGSGAGQIQFTAPVTGFTAIGNAANINLGGAAGTLQWGSAFFNPTVLLLNDANADNVLDFKNGLDLNGAVRTISVTSATANSATISGIISNSSGTAGLIKIDSGTLILSGANTYGGTTTLSQGVLAAGHDSAFGTSTVLLSGGILQAAGGPRTVANNFVLVSNSTVSGTNSLKVTGDFTFNADGNDITNSMTGAAVFELAGNVYLSNSEDSSFTSEFFGAGTTLISGIIANNSGDNTLASHVFFNAPGILRLTGVNTYTGRTLAAGGGAIAISQDRNIGQAPVAPVVDSIILANLGRLRIEESFTLDADRSIGIGNSTGGAATGIIEVITDKAFTVNGTIANRTLNTNGSATTGTPNVGSLTKTGNGVLTLGGNNTHSGTTTVSAGILRATSATALGTTTGGTTVNAGAHLELANGVTITGETLTINGSGRSVASPDSPGVNRGALQAAAGATATWAGDIILNNTVSRLGTQAGGTLIVTGVISDGANNFALQIGADIAGGTVLLSGANTYGDGLTASTQIIRGTLKLGAHNTLPTVTVLDVHTPTTIPTEISTVDLNGFNQAIAVLQGTGASATNAFVTNSDTDTESTLTINQDSNSTYAGAITGNLAVVKNGTGTLTLSGPNSFRGTLTMNSGSLILSGNNTYQGDTIINGGTVFSGGNGLPDGAGRGDVYVNGGATTAGSLDLINADEIINGLNGSSGAVLGRVFNNATSATLRILTVGADGDNGSYAGLILDNTGGAALGTVAIRKFGRGTQTFTGANTSTGPVIAYNGTLEFDYSAGADVLNGQTVALRGGTVVFKGNSTGTTAETIGAVTTLAISSSRIVISNNGGAGTTVTTGAWTSGGGTSGVFVDVSGGGVLKTTTAFGTADGAANTFAIKNGILMAGTNVGGTNGYRGMVLVKDATGIGFATQNASNEIVRYTGATALAAASNSVTTNYILSADLTKTGTAFQFSTLQIDTGSTFTSGESIDLNIGASTMLTGMSVGNGHAILITGANDASITGTNADAVLNSLFVANHGTGTFTLNVNMNAQALVNYGSGLTVYNMADLPGDVYALGGTLRFTQNMTHTGGLMRILGGGIFEIGADLNGANTGDFDRTINPTSGLVMIGNGGFSAFGANRVVSLGGATPTNLTWGASNFMASSDGFDANFVLMLGSSTSNAMLELVNNINLGTRTRTVDVGNGVNANDVDARLSGVLSGANGALEKIGTGTLEVTGANTYGTGTTIAAGKFLANNIAGSATGTGHVTVLSGATLGGTGTVTASTGTQHITVNSGATLMVGNTHGVGTGGGGAASAFSLQTSDGGIVTLAGTVQLDLFGNTNDGSGTNPASDNDVLRLTSETSVVIDGTLVVFDTTGTSLSWGLGATWRLIDWANVSAAQHNAGTFDDFILPTLNTGLSWDTSKIYTDGTISIAGVVPEPGRALLLMAGTITLVLRRRRSRK